MRVRLLGPVCLQSRNSTVRPASGRARSLLAVLAWEPNGFVADEVLIQRIWGPSVPSDPRDALYTSAKRLRGSIREISATDCLVRRRGGYLLRTEPDRIDLHRFRRLTAAARAAERDDRRSGLYKQAIRLWSGTPLADVDCAWSRGARESMTVEWLTARIAAIEVDLRLGRHAEVAPALISLMHEYPRDERIAAMLMLALYLNGQRAEALTWYTRIRTGLVESLGNEPGAALRRLHLRILHDDHTLREL
ncbi:BTAD domain-containing putative transcriptional regulator [Nonomuraea sp. NPDC050153]|uniref:AfsR/SARP family transcriptional regulator n=1 Tax=Nonomuraea sp. NPDC050153 TaxID=3364359 RepID=UPI0037994F72